MEAVRRLRMRLGSSDVASPSLLFLRFAAGSCAIHVIIYLCTRNAATYRWLGVCCQVGAVLLQGVWRDQQPGIMADPKGVRWLSQRVCLHRYLDKVFCSGLAGGVLCVGQKVVGSGAERTRAAWRNGVSASSTGVGTVDARGM